MRGGLVTYFWLIFLIIGGTDLSVWGDVLYYGKFVRDGELGKTTNREVLKQQKSLIVVWFLM